MVGDAARHISAILDNFGAQSFCHHGSTTALLALSLYRTDPTSTEFVCQVLHNVSRVKPTPGTGVHIRSPPPILAHKCLKCCRIGTVATLLVLPGSVRAFLQSVKVRFTQHSGWHAMSMHAMCPNGLQMHHHRLYSGVLASIEVVFESIYLSG